MKKPPPRQAHTIHSDRKRRLPLDTPTPRSDVIVEDLTVDRRLVTLQGEHDLSTAPVLRDQLEAVLRTGTAVVVDLSTTPFIDSSIIAALVDANQRTEASDEKRFGLVVAPETQPERLLGLVGLLRVMDVYRSVEAALAEFADDDVISMKRWKERKQRIVKNEQEFRDYNNRRLQVEDVSPSDTEALLPFVCECGDTDCIETLASPRPSSSMHTQHPTASSSNQATSTPTSSASPSSSRPTPSSRNTSQR